MAKKLEFNVVETTTLEDFLRAVNQKLQEGWKLRGSMIAFTDLPDHESVSRVHYIQAFTRRQTGS